MDRDEIIRKALEINRIPDHIRRAQEELTRISRPKDLFHKDLFEIPKNRDIRQQFMEERNRTQELRLASNHLLEKRLHNLQDSLSYREKSLLANERLDRDYQKISAERFKEDAIFSSMNARKKYEELVSPNFWRDQQRDIQIRREMFESKPIIQDYGKRIRDETLLWEKNLNNYRKNEDLLFKNSVFQATNAFEKNIDSFIKSSIRDSHFLESQRSLASRISDPGIAYSQFARRTLNRINRLDDPFLRAANIDALNLAENQITKSTQMINDIRDISMSTKIETLWLPLEKPIINLFRNQRREVIDNYEIVITEQPINLAEVSISTQIADLTRKCFNTMIQCNKDRKLQGQEVIFKLTDLFVEASTNLPFIIAENEETLGKVMDYLYMTIYEGAGSGSLRYLSADLFAIDDISVVMVVKSLRSKWLRHDIDHGKQREIDKKWLDLNESLQFIGFERFPKIKEEYIRLQLNLLKKLDEFLNLLEEKVNFKSVN